MLALRVNFRLKKLLRRLGEMNNNALRRLDWKQMESEEGGLLVRGTGKRVIVVKSPDPRLFEEAIFILRDDLGQGGRSAEQVMMEARSAASSYLRGATVCQARPRLRLRPALIAAAGAIAAAIAWIAVRFVVV